MVDAVWTSCTTPRAPRFADGVVAPFQQHPLYAAACGLMGTPSASYQLAAAGQRPIGWAQILVRRWPGLGRVAMLARGPVWAPDLLEHDRVDALHTLLDKLRDEHRIVIATPDPIAQVDCLARRGWLAMVAGGTTARLPLHSDSAILKERMHGKWRNRLLRAQSAGLKVTLSPLPDDQDHWLLKAEAEQARMRGYKRLPPEFTRAWRRAGGPRSTMLATAQRGQEMVAGMVFLRHGATASYHVGWTSPDGRACDAHRLLLYRAALRLCHKGHKMLDLGTLDTVTTPGLARFKLGAGASPVSLGATRIKAPGTTLIARMTGDGLLPFDKRGARQSQVAEA